MSSLTTNPARSAQRAQIVAEAVVSTYIHEIAATQHTRKPARDRRGAGSARAYPSQFGVGSFSTCQALLRPAPARARTVCGSCTGSSSSGALVPRNSLVRL